MTGRNAGLPRARSIIVRSTSSTADGAELDDVARAFHRAIERRKVDDAERAVRRQRRELQRQLARPRERALAADEQMREVDAAVGGVGPLALRMEDVDVVAAHAAQHLRHACARSRRARARRSRADASTSARTRGGAPAISRSGPKRAVGAVGEQRVDRLDVVHHVAVGDRARAARVVAGHAAERRLRRRADVDRKPQAVRLQPRIQLRRARCRARR